MENKRGEILDVCGLSDKTKQLKLKKMRNILEGN